MIPPDEDVLATALKDPHLASSAKTQFKSSAFHKGSHGNYTEQIKEAVRDLQTELSRIPNPSQAQKAYYRTKLEGIASKAKTAIQNGQGKSIDKLKLGL